MDDRLTIRSDNLESNEPSMSESKLSSDISDDGGYSEAKNDSNIQKLLEEINRQNRGDDSALVSEDPPNSASLSNADDISDHEGIAENYSGHYGELNVPPRIITPNTVVTRAASRRKPPGVRRGHLLLNLTKSDFWDIAETIVKSEEAGDAFIINTIENIPFSGISEYDIPADPETWNDAIRSKHCKEWLDAAASEIRSIMDHDVWEIVDLNACSESKPHLVGCKWVFKFKTVPSFKFKARLVAKGFSQREGLDYFETYSPTMRNISLWIFLAYAASYDLNLIHLDIGSAFLNGTLEESIFMRIPEGFERILNVLGEDVPDLNNKCLKLRKALYGLKQAPRQWYNELSRTLISLEFKQLDEDRCLYKYCGSDESIKCSIGVFVDDLAVACNSEEFVETLKLKLAAHYKLNDYGSLKEFLGYEITRDRPSRVIQLSQIKYLAKVLERFGIKGTGRIASTPMSETIDLHSGNESTAPYQGSDFRAAVGCLLYLSGGTRPDIAYAVHQVSQFSHDPNNKHWFAVVRILKYLAGQPTLGITLGGDLGSGLLGYADANHGGEISSRRSRKSGLFIDGGKSTTGYIFYLGNSPVSWRAKKQTRFTATSSSEAEVIALVDATKEASWLSRLCKAICNDYPMDKPVRIYEDNTSCLSIVTRGTLSDRTKHFRVEYYYVTSEIEDGHITLEHCPTSLMIADTFTKALPKSDFIKFRDTFMSELLSVDD